VSLNISEIWTDILDSIGQAWWIKISTVQPNCTYYFGPFACKKEADLAIAGYVEDLESESAQGIQTQVRCCKPTFLTIE
jgi:Domain of unknown function (DUF1816)